METEVRTEQDWCAIVDRMAHGDGSAVEDLYRGLDSIRGFFRHHLGWENYEDAYHELIVDLLQQIRSGKLREPEHLDRYAFSIARNKVARGLRQILRDRNSDPLPQDVSECPETASSPESAVAQQESVVMALRVLQSLQPREREIITRFYFDGQSPKTIQTELDLNQTQFRLLKCRAKARLKELCEAKLAAGAAYTRFTA